MEASEFPSGCVATAARPSRPASSSYDVLLMLLPSLGSTMESPLARLLRTASSGLHRAWDKHRQGQHSTYRLLGAPHRVNREFGYTGKIDLLIFNIFTAGRDNLTFRLRKTHNA